MKDLRAPNHNRQGAAFIETYQSSFCICKNSFGRKSLDMMRYFSRSVDHCLEQTKSLYEVLGPSIFTRIWSRQTRSGVLDLEKKVALLAVKRLTATLKETSRFADSNGFSELRQKRSCRSLAFTIWGHVAVKNVFRCRYIASTMSKTLKSAEPVRSNMEMCVLQWSTNLLG